MRFLLSCFAASAVMAFACSGPGEGSGQSTDALQCAPGSAAEWAENVAYATGAPVRYRGKAYRCIQGHTSLAGWTPDAVPALWGEVSLCPDDPGKPDAGSDATPDWSDSGKPPPPPPPPPGSRVLVGYWHNFDNGSGFIKLKDVSTKWNVVNISFAEPTSASQIIGFTPYGYPSAAAFKAEVDAVRARGQKVVISIGGANGHVELRNATERQNFVDSMIGIISQYGFDGMDIDFEGQSLHLDAGDTDVKNPKTPVITNLIGAIRAIRDRFGSAFLLTMAPETFFVQVGYTNYGGSGSGDNRAGAYLPVIHAVRDILGFLQVQHYNSGPVMGLDDQYHFMGGADFHIAMADMVLRGFPVAKNPNNVFPALRQDQVVIGLPASVNAGNGFTSVADVQSAVGCLVKGNGCGAYKPKGVYPNLRGLMTWSINWDAFNKFEFSNAHRAYLDSL